MADVAPGAGLFQNVRPRWARPGYFSGRIAAPAAGAFIILLAIVAAAAPWIAPHDPQTIELTARNLGWTAAHPLGTDSLGRDLASRLLWGARPALIGPVIAVSISTLIGTAVGIATAWRGGWIDGLVGRLLDGMFAFPGILLVLLMVALFGPSLRTAVLTLSIAYVPFIARVVRSAAMTERVQPYIEACLVQGMSAIRICARHLFPNILAIVAAQATVMFGFAIVALAAISYLGLGVPQGDADWGAMVASGQETLVTGHPNESLLAGLLLVMEATAFTLLGSYIGERGGK